MSGPTCTISSTELDVAESFDPYHIWLGIPPAEQPADHYRLLGISRFESNPDVIGNAADQRVRHVRTMQTGKRQAESQRLLNEIAAAAGTLLDRERREEYDVQLKAQEALRHPEANRTAIVAASAQHRAPLSIPSLSDLELPASTPLSRALPQPTYAATYRPVADSSTNFPLVPIVAATVGALVLVVVVGAVLSALNRKEPGIAVTPSQPNPIKQREQPSPAVRPKVEPASQEATAPKVTTPDPTPPPPEAEVPKPPPPAIEVEPRDINFATKDGKSLTVRFMEKLDLLAAERTMIKGELSAKSGSTGAFTGGNDPDRAEIQFALPSVYLIESKLTRLRGEDTIIFGIMVGGHPTSLVIDGYSGIGPWSGLELVG